MLLKYGTMKKLKEACMRDRLLSYCVVSFLALATLSGCSSSKGEGVNGSNTTGPIFVPNGGDGGNGGTGSGNGNGSGAEALAKCNASVCATVASPGPACAAEVCDGLDNDCNGIIDDLDVGNDGICDCIMIATLGVPGTWGQGDVFGAWLTARASNGAASLGSQVLTDALLKPYQVIVVENVNALTPSDNTGGIGRVYSQAEITALTNWVNGGGGLMTLTGFSDPTERTNVNAILGAFGMNYGSQPILPKGGNTTVAITNWFAHPTTAGITRIGVDNGYESQSTQNLGTVVASQNNLNVGRALDAGLGHVFQWGDEWITYNSEWTQHPDYQVQLFWLNIIKWLTPPKVCQVSIPPILVN